MWAYADAVEWLTHQSIDKGLDLFNLDAIEEPIYSRKAVTDKLRWCESLNVTYGWIILHIHFDSDVIEQKHRPQLRYQGIENLEGTEAIRDEEDAF